MPRERPTQQEFNGAVRAIEGNTCFRLTAADDESGAFFVPVAPDGKTVMGAAFHLTWKKVKGLAEVAATKPQSIGGKR